MQREIDIHSIPEDSDTLPSINERTGMVNLYGYKEFEQQYK